MMMDVPLQGFGKSGTIGKPVFRMVCQGFGKDAIHIPMQCGIELGRCFPKYPFLIFLLLLQQRNKRIIFRKGKLRHHCLEKQRPCGIDVGPAIDIGCGYLFRRHVQRRAQDHLLSYLVGFHYPGCPEVGYQGPFAVLFDQNIGGFYVPVDDTFPVGVIQSVRYLDGDPLMRLINLKWYLRGIANALMDQAIHAGDT